MIKVPNKITQLKQSEKIDAFLAQNEKLSAD